MRIEAGGHGKNPVEFVRRHSASLVIAGSLAVGTPLMTFGIVGNKMYH